MRRKRRGGRRKQKNPVDEFFQHLMDSPEELLQITLIVVVGVMVLGELGAQGFLNPLIQMFNLYLVASSVITFTLFIGAVAYAVNWYENRKKYSTGI